jgi:hypothetical protein
MDKSIAETNSYSLPSFSVNAIDQQSILKTSCMQANLNFFMRSGAPAAHDVSTISDTRELRLGL